MAAETGTGVPEEPFLLDSGRQALAPLLALRPLVWRRVPEATAKNFDSGLYLLSVVLDTLHWRADVDSEDAMAQQLPQAGERLADCARVLRGLGEKAPADAITGNFTSVTAPVRTHLALVQAAQRVHSGTGSALKLLPEEYLLLCAQCQAPAERLRVYADSVSFSRRTGAVSAPSYPRERAAELFSTLERDGANALCAGLERGGRKIIGYCPDCDALYCPAHYETQEKWSGSWLEALHGTCAKGHRREIA